eukprot:9102655-Heterocapsa_arctica.AAC.1
MIRFKPIAWKCNDHINYNLGIRQRLRAVVHDNPRAGRKALVHFTNAMASSSRSTGFRCQQSIPNFKSLADDLSFLKCRRD